jgi:hypothetical protein
MGSPLWKRGVRGDFIEILTQLGSEFASASIRNRVAHRNDNLLLAFVLIKPNGAASWRTELSTLIDKITIFGYLYPTYHDKHHRCRSRRK